MYTELAFELVVFHSPAVLPKTQRHRRQRWRCFGERNLRGRLPAEQLRGTRNRIARRRRLVVGDVENAARPVSQRRMDRLGDVGHVDAIENLAWFGDAARSAAGDLNERIAAGPVDAGEAENRDRSAGLRAEFAPSVLGGEPLLPASASPAASLASGLADLPSNARTFTRPANRALRSAARSMLRTVPTIRSKPLP